MAKKQSKKNSKRTTNLTPRKRRDLSCYFDEKGTVPDYKNPNELNQFVTTRAKIVGRRSGLCAKHQRQLAISVKRARHLGLLPFKMSLG